MLNFSPGSNNTQIGIFGRYIFLMPLRNPFEQKFMNLIGLVFIIHFSISLRKSNLTFVMFNNLTNNFPLKISLFCNFVVVEYPLTSCVEWYSIRVEKQFRMYWFSKCSLISVRIFLIILVSFSVNSAKYLGLRTILQEF